MKNSIDLKNFLSISYRLMIYSKCLAFMLTFGVLTYAQSDQDIATAIELYNQGVTLVSKNENQKALEKFTEAINLNTGLPQAYINRAVIYIASSRESEAGADVDKAILLLERSSSSPKLFAIAYQLKGLILKQQKNNQAALEYFAKSIVHDPQNAKTYINRAILYIGLSQYDQALIDLNKAEEIDATVVQTFINRSLVYRHKNNYVAALKDIEQAISLDSGNDVAYYNRGHIRSSLNKNEEAIADFNKALSLAKKPHYYHALALMYHQLGKHDLSLNAINEALKLDPNFIYGYRVRAFAYFNLGKLQLAIEDARKATSLKSGSPNAHYNLAYFLIRSKQYALAAIEATKAIELAPQWKMPYTLRGRAYAMLSKAALAKADQDKASKLSGSGRPKEEDSLFSSMEIYLSEDF